ncbi:hypothetical protein LINGRAHAP2_LOCUS25874 [Linum grandiflorum]
MMESAASHKVVIIASSGDNEPKEAAAAGSHRSGEEEEREKEESSSSDGSELDLELGLVVDINEISDEDDDKEVHLSNAEIRDCRICHMSLDEESGGGLPIDLGCSCKDDLAASHRHCAEAWFKIKGNKTCEICGSVARNVAGPTEPEGASAEQWSDQGNDQAAVAASASAGGTAGNLQTESNAARHFWQGHRFLNFLLACMVFAFVISWLFHFNVPS